MRESERRTLVRVPATDVVVGDRLDSACKVRVHAISTLGDGTVVLGYRVRGSRAPGAHAHAADATVSVWRLTETR